jgi:type IV secretion system protein VirB4
VVSLQRFRTPEPGLPDLLNFAGLVDDGVVLGKDGALMAGWLYRGSDSGSSTDDELSTKSARLNAALARLGSGWMTHHDAIRIPAKHYPAAAASHFPDVVSRWIDEERRRQFEAEGAHYENLYALVVTYLPPVATVRKLAGYMYADDPARPRHAEASQVLEVFRRRIAELEDALSAVFELQRLRGVRYVDEFGTEHVSDDLLQYLNRTITGDDHPINVPPCPMYLDAVLGAREFWTGLMPKVGERFIAVVAIDGFPLESAPALLGSLDALPVRYRWSTRFIYLDAEEAKAHLGRYRRKWQQKTRGFADQVMRTNRSGIDQDAAAMVGETETALGEASSQLVTFGYFTSVIVLMEEERETLEASAREVRRALQNLGFGARIETVNSVEAWLGSIPGHGLPNVRRPLLHTLHLADLLPTAAIWAGRDHCPCPFYPPGAPPLLHAATDGATPFRLNLHVGDVGHTLVFGPTGAGKSTLLALLVAQFRRYEGATIFAFDKGRSLFALAHACGAQHWEVGDGGSTRLCPLAEIESDAEQSWAEEWIETCATLQLGEGHITPLHRNLIHAAMRLQRAAPREARTLTNFVTNVQHSELKQALEFYTISGAGGDLLDRDHEDLRAGLFQVFEIEELMNRGDKLLIPVLLYLFRRFERSLTGQPALLVLDEAWLMLGHPVFRAKIREWLKVLRKANCAVVLATQSLSDAVRSGILDVLLESCPTKILLPNEEATKGDSTATGPRQLYELMGLNPRQIEIIATAIPKRQYYFLSPEGRRLIELNLGPVALAFVGAGSKTELARIQQLVRTHGVDWPAQWLAARGVTAPAAR